MDMDYVIAGLAIAPFVLVTIGLTVHEAREQRAERVAACIARHPAGKGRAAESRPYDWAVDGL